jgi:predicted dehydrogenase
MENKKVHPVTSEDEKKRILNIGIVGLGKMGLLHTGILNSIYNVKTVAISEKEKIIAKYLKSSLPDINLYEDYEKMFEAEDLDLVYITTPVSSHFPITSLCIKNKINFFVEKPLTGTLEESERLCTSLKQKHQIIHSVGYNRRFIPTFSRAKVLLDTKILGDTSYVKSSMYVSNILSKPTGWRSKKNVSGGGVLLDLGAHVIDLLLWFFCPISSVSGQIKSIYSDEVEDFAHMDMNFGDGMRGELDTSWSTEGYRVSELNIEIVGNNGKMKVNEDYIKLELKKPANGLNMHEDSSDNKNETTLYKQELGEGVPIDVGGPEYTREDLHVVDCVFNKKQSLVNVFEASKTQSVIQAMYDAARNGDSRKKVEYFR